MLRTSVKFFSLTPGAPSHPSPLLRHRRPELHSSQWAEFFFFLFIFLFFFFLLYALFKPSADRRKTHDRQSLPYLQLHQTGTHIIQRGTHRTEVTEDSPLWEKQGWGPVLNLPLAVLDEPPGQILLGGLSSVELWEDLSGWLTTSAPLIQAVRVPVESPCHCL